MKKALALVLGGLLSATVASAGRPSQIPLPFASNTWQSIGPPGGPVTAIAANPQNANELYAAESSNIIKSTDGGSTWTKIATINAAVYDLVINPTNQNILYVLSLYGIYKSTDRGLTWTLVSFGSGNYSLSGKLGVNRTDGNTIYASGYRYESSLWNYMAIFKSTDGGNSWTVEKISPAGTDSRVRGLAVFPTNPNIVYAGGYYYDGYYNYRVYKTTNGGGSWQDVTGPINLEPYDIVIDPNNSSKVYVGTQGKFFRTSDGGATWDTNAAGFVYANAIAIDPVNTNILFAGYINAVYKSTDGGQNWTSSSDGVFGTGCDFYIEPSGSSLPFWSGTTGAGILFATTAGIFRSADGGTHWQDSSSGICAISAYPIGLCTGSPNKLFVRCTKNGFFKTDNYGETWQRCASYSWCDFAGRILVNPNNASEIFIAGGLGIYKSVDGANTWSLLTTKTPTDLTTAADNFTHLFGVTYEITYQTYRIVFYKSTNGGETWTTSDVTRADTYGYAIAVDPTNENVIYVGGSSWSSDHSGSGAVVYKTINGGSSWTEVSSGFLDGIVWALAIDPADTNRIYAGTPGGLYRSDNGGAFWTKVGTNDTGHIAINKNAPAEIYISGDDGVYFSNNLGATWQDFKTGLTDKNVASLAFDPTNNIIYAGTSDAGVFRYSPSLMILTLTCSSGGTTSPEAGTLLYPEGTSVQIAATPNAQYRFMGWTGDASGSANPVTIVMNGNKSIQANFVIAVKPPLSLSGEKLVNRNVSIVESVARLKWQANTANTGTITYRVYQIENGQATKVADVVAGTYEYIVRKLQKTKSYQFGVTAVNSLGWESDMVSVTIQ